MPTNSNSRNSRSAMNKGARDAKDVKRTTSVAMDDFDPILQPSQSSSEDGMMATIAQQMQASMEKKKKEKEGKFLQAAQVELTRTLSEKAHDFADGTAELDKIFSDFQDKYAKNEDNIRRLWDTILKGQVKLQKIVEEKQKTTVEREKRREQEHIQALAHGKKACEDFQRLIVSLEPRYEAA